MKSIYLNIAIILLSIGSFSQVAKVVVFKHELRWTDETRFPNYFLYQDIRDSIFKDTKLELMKNLGVSQVDFPEAVAYDIINGFGNQKIQMPKTASGNDFEIGLFSFITRATVGELMFWKLNIVIRQNNKIILEKEVVHELEYFNVSGYVTSQQWLSPEEFYAVFKRLVKEGLGVLPANKEKIVLGSLDAQEKKASALLLQPKRHLLKINGAWKSASNFSALLESTDDTILNFNFKDELIWEFPKPTLSEFLAPLFTKATGISILYDNKVTNQRKGTLLFSDGQKFGINLKWIEIETKSTTSDEVTRQRISNPLIAELFTDKEQIGYFVYTRLENVRTTDKTEGKFNPFNGYQTKNTLGIEQIHRIEGSLYNKPLFAEYNENRGIIEIRSGEERLGVMVVQNCNPENQSISNVRLSKNKLFMSSSSGNIGKPSLGNTKSVEWYPFYFPENSPDNSRKICIETMVCLFFGIGSM